MTIFVSRAEWQARQREQGTTSISPKPSITIHWEGAGWKWPWDHSTCDDKVRGIQAYHMDTRGWSDIAYNYLGCPHNYLYEGRGYDRRSSANGFDSANYASFALQGMWGSSAGVLVPANLKRALLFGINLLQEKGHASSIIKGHRDWHETDCPGDELYSWIKLGCPSPDYVSNLSKDFDVATIGDLRNELNLIFTDGHKGYDTVQAFSAFNAENLRQRIDDIANAADAAQIDDFAILGQMVKQNQEQIEQMQTTLTAILQKLNNPPS